MLLMLHLVAVVFWTSLKTGISITASPCTDCDGGDLTCVDGVCLLRCVNVTPSGECLQCRESRFYGKQCENHCTHTCLNSRCQLKNSRVVCTEGCVAGWKGDDCTVACSKSCNQCERFGDKCIGQCSNSDYYGDKCNELCLHNCGRCGRENKADYKTRFCNITCPVNCRRECDRDSGYCDSCVPGFRGDYCNETCPSTCSKCERQTSICQECKSGYGGTACNVSCPYGCKDHCDKDTGKCSRCKPRFLGSHCDNCKPGYWGTLCNETCPSGCKEGCDKDSGICHQCESGYRDSHCNETCLSVCRDGCDRYTGICEHCEAGYRGRHCNESCLSKCDAECDRNNGECKSCIDGYRGRYCDIDDTKLPLTIACGLMGVIVVAGCCVVGVVLVRRKHQRQKRLPSQDANQQQPRESSSGQYWATKYWELDDGNMDPDSVSNDVLHVQPQRVPTPAPHPERRDSLSLCLSREETPLFSQSRSAKHQEQRPDSIVLGLSDRVTDNPHYASAEFGTACSGDVRSLDDRSKASTLTCPLDNGQAELSNRSKSVCSVTSEDLRLTSKTESMILWEQNTDFSKVNVKYITPNVKKHDFKLGKH